MSTRHTAEVGQLSRGSGGGKDWVFGVSETDVHCLGPFETMNVCGSGLTGTSGNARETQAAEWGLATSSGWREWQGKEGAVQTQGVWLQTVTYHKLRLFAIYISKTLTRR